MSLYKAVIVDTQKVAREHIADVLREKSEIEVALKCGSGKEAIEFINVEQPALVFLEIELSKISGFEVIKNITTDVSPLFVLISNSKEYAMEAFEIEALDYIQKPFSAKRIEKSLDRFHKRIQNGFHESSEDIGNLIQDLQRPTGLERFIIKQSGEYHLIKMADIIWIEADGNYSRIMTTDKKFMVRYTLSGFDEQLSSNQFYRISRSQIVNLDYVVKIKDHIYGNYIVELNNGISLKMSKNYKELFNALKNF